MIALIHTTDNKHFKQLGCRDCYHWKGGDNGAGTCRLLESRGIDGLYKVTGRNYFCGSIMLKKTGEQVNWGNG